MTREKILIELEADLERIKQVRELLPPSMSVADFFLKRASDSLAAVTAAIRAETMRPQRPWLWPNSFSKNRWWTWWIPIRLKLAWFNFCFPSAYLDSKKVMAKQKDYEVSAILDDASTPPKRKKEL